jgi:hypothetical protein
MLRSISQHPGDYCLATIPQPTHPNHTHQLPIQSPTSTTSTIGGGGLYNGSMPSYSGWPGVPFNGSSRYFRTRQSGSMAFALVGNSPIHVTSKSQFLYFDWFVDNPWPYWFVAQTMSINANNSNIIMHQARVDLYDYDKLEPAGNFTHLAALLFDEYSAEAGGAFLASVLLPDVIAQTPNLASMATMAPLGDHLGKRVLVAFRYSTVVYYLAFGIDNVMMIDCKDWWWADGIVP